MKLVERFCPECQSSDIVLRKTEVRRITWGLSFYEADDGRVISTETSEEDEEVLDSEYEEFVLCRACGAELEEDELEDELEECEHVGSEDGYCLECAEYTGADDYEEVDR